MRNFIAYHSAERMGYTVDESNRFGIYSRKSGPDVDDIIWVVTGEGKSPRKYFLSSWFTISRRVPANHPDFLYSYRGECGREFDPKLRIDEEVWFPTFRKRMANFSIGLSPLNDEEVQGFLGAASRSTR